MKICLNKNEWLGTHTSHKSHKCWPSVGVHIMWQYKKKTFQYHDEFSEEFHRFLEKKNIMRKSFIGSYILICNIIGEKSWAKMCGFKLPGCEGQCPQGPGWMLVRQDNAHELLHHRGIPNVNMNWTLSDIRTSEYFFQPFLMRIFKDVV